MPRFISNELFHFVGRRHPKNHEGNYLNLKQVLESGRISHPPHDSDWGTTQIVVNTSKSLDSEELVVPTITCYCDIPFESLGLHLQKYGHFGISFSKDFLIQFGARPVIYVPLHPNNWGSPFGRSLLHDIEAVYKGFKSQILPIVDSNDITRSRSIGVEPKSLQEAVLALDSVFSKDFLAFIKPYDAQLSLEDTNYYYAEREWRKFGNLKFESSNVTRIVVDRTYLKRARMEFPEYADKIYVAPLEKNWLVKLFAYLNL
jgi:CO dehydrogenase/acetyl-CoA synthase epsilon subunit